MAEAPGLPDSDSPAGRWAAEHLADDIVAWLTTVAPDGTPQSSVICFLWERGSILFWSKPNVPRIRNIRLNPRVAFHLQSDPFGDHAFTLEGIACIEEDAPRSDEHGVYLAKYLEPYAHWGMDAKQTADEFPVAIRVTPTRIRAF